jgi:hypothetical protein
MKSRSIRKRSKRKRSVGVKHKSLKKHMDGVKKTQPKDLQKKQDEWFKNYYSKASGDGDCLYSCVFRTLRDKQLYLPIQTEEKFIQDLRNDISRNLTKDILKTHLRKILSEYSNKEMLKDILKNTSLENYIDIDKNINEQGFKEDYLLKDVKDNIKRGTYATELEIGLINNWLSSMFIPTVIKVLSTGEKVPEDWNINDKNIYITNISDSKSDNPNPFNFNFNYFINKKKVLEEKKKQLEQFKKDKAEFEKKITEKINQFKKMKEQLKNIKNIEKVEKKIEKTRTDFKSYTDTFIRIFQKSNPKTHEIFLKDLVNKLETEKLIKNKDIITNEILKQIEIKHEQLKTNANKLKLKLKELKTKEKVILTKKDNIENVISKLTSSLDKEIMNFDLDILDFEERKLTYEINKIKENYENIKRYSERFKEIFDKLIEERKQNLEKNEIFLKEKEELKLLETNMVAATSSDNYSELRDLYTKKEKKIENLVNKEIKVLETKKDYYDMFYDIFKKIQENVTLIDNINTNNINSLDINKLKQKHNEIMLNIRKIIYNDFKNLYKNRSNFIKTKLKELKNIDAKLKKIYSSKKITRDNINSINNLYNAMLTSSTQSYALQNHKDMFNMLQFITDDEIKSLFDFGF